MSTVLVRVARIGVQVSWDGLDAEERQRAERRTDPRLFVSAHVLLRGLVAEHLGVPGESLAFDRSCATCGSRTHGKPAVTGHPGLHVSISYAGELAVAALSRDGAVGVDVETLATADFDGFDAVTLDATERPALAGLSGRERLRARCRVWTRKEAILKATGHGLAIDPRQVVVSGPGEPPTLRRWSSSVAGPSVLALADVGELLGRDTSAERSEGGEHEVAVAVLGEGPLAVRIG